MLNCCKKAEHNGVEQRRFFQIDEMSCARHHAQGGIGKGALEKKVWFETGRVLIADNKQSRTIQSAQRIGEMP